MQMPLDRVQKNEGGVVNPTTSEPYLEQPVLLFGLARRKIFIGIQGIVVYFAPET